MPRSANGNLTVRSPWPGQSVTVIDNTGTTVVAAQTAATFSLPVQTGKSYLIQRTSAPTTALPFAVDWSACEDHRAARRTVPHVAVVVLGQADGSAVEALRRRCRAAVDCGYLPMLAIMAVRIWSPSPRRAASSASKLQSLEVR